MTYWNAFVANLEMHGKGTFFDSRLDDPSNFLLPPEIISDTSRTRRTW